MKFTTLLFTLITVLSLNAQQSKKQIKKNINNWYENHPERYHIIVSKSDATAKITNYYPNRKNQENNLIQMNYKGMKITLAFSKSLNTITTHKDSLQKYFSYVSLANIYTTIVSKNWIIYPETPSSSLRNKGVTFTNGGSTLGLTINWSIYTIMGYRNSKTCNEERQIMDMGISEPCYVSIRKALPLVISINEVPLK